ncbi:MAG: hypothetical protein K9M98_12770 [Cephaloticoccus sp.]|nr:hypothetical protein [Cephaloticoccus sp.]MCF7761365.1 hypothetical protein [Cephaloticoccus sp.]
METGCEAVTGWSKPVRFQKVCPLLKQSPGGAWVCSVSAQEVRPFWGRVGIYFGTTGFVIWVILIGSAFWGMRLIGYHVSLRQLVWPPAWHELQGVRADLFIEMARTNYRAGRVREAIQSLSIAHELNPTHYQVAMMLAQFNQAGNASQSDLLYGQLLQNHPERRSEIARAWFQSLLARGRMTDIAELAKRQLLAEPEQAQAWTFALLFATRHRTNDEMLPVMAADDALPAAPREVLKLAAKVRKLPPALARQALLETPVVAGFSYDLVFRIEELIRLGYPQDALAVLAQIRSGLSGRDVARLVFSAYAAQHNQDRLLQEFRALLAPKRNLRAAECTLLAVHLIKYPDPVLLSMLVEATKRLPVEPADAWMESALAVFCAAGVQGKAEQMHAVKQMITDTYAISPLGLSGMELFFLGKSEQALIETFLPNLNPLSLELNYALLDRYYKMPPAK